MLVLYLAEAVSTIVAMRHFQLIKIWDKKGKIQEKRERSGKKGKKLGGKGENLHKHRHRYATGCTYDHSRHLLVPRPGVRDRDQRLCHGADGGWAGRGPEADSRAGYQGNGGN